MTNQKPPHVKFCPKCRACNWKSAWAYIVCGDCGHRVRISPRIHPRALNFRLPYRKGATP